MIDHLLLFILLALFAEIIGTIGGFGSSMLFVPLASLFLDFHIVLGITAFYHIASNLSKIFFFKENLNRNLILHLGIPAIIFVLLGSYLSQFFSSQILEILLALFLIILSLLLYYFDKFKLNASNKNSIIGGITSGFIAGLVGTGGAIRGLVLTSYNLKPTVFIATSAMIDLGIDISRSFVYTYNGYVKKEHLFYIPILILVSIVGTFIGKKIIQKLSQEQFKKIVLLLTFLTGLFTLVKTWTN